MAKSQHQPIRPFLKWAGNKFRILHHIQRTLPGGKRLVEPFVGSGAVFLNTDYEDYLLCDSNRDLVDLFKLLKRRGQAFVDSCRPYFEPRYNNADAYYRLRDRFNQTDDREERAVLFVYLNRHGYNGLCRYNLSGGFNVPFGRYQRPYFPEREMLAFRDKAKQARFKHQAFEQTFVHSDSGDVIYCDPPYLPLSSSANFTSYSAGGFSMAQQQELARLARVTSERGIPVLISNHHDKAFTTEYYDGARIETFDVQRFISRNGANRAKAGEVLALFGT
ncbi:MAG: Dam family site-specific DNA-(adenine-N6)-methyltransferase [Gammaproteobacteria bacterium]|nr:Dam family site-specific DNA-(adenine-N6)-methyltransferase [Gammaproteobacteria bacterium]